MVICAAKYLKLRHPTGLLTECSIIFKDGIATVDPFPLQSLAVSLVLGFVGMSDIDESLTTEQAKELIRLCRTGRLHDLQKWIADGRSLQIPSVPKKTLLQIAVEVGFHSLVELIAMHESSQPSKNAALANAVSMRRLDLVQLLSENGADIKSVPLADVLLCWEPKIIRFFLDHGAEAVTGSPFAIAFGARVRTALRPSPNTDRRILNSPPNSRPSWTAHSVTFAAKLI